MEQVKKQGYQGLIFPVSDAFEKQFSVLDYIFAKSLVLYDKNTIKFVTHAEIDEFVHYCLKIDPQLKEHFRPEFDLLKSVSRKYLLTICQFDRGFWFLRARNKQNEDFKPADNKCPFNVPKKHHIMQEDE